MEPINQDHAETFSDEDLIAAVAPPEGEYVPVRITILRRSNRGGLPRIVFEAYGIYRRGRIVDMAEDINDAIRKARKRSLGPGNALGLSGASGRGNEMVANPPDPPAPTTPVRTPSPFRRGS